MGTTIWSPLAGGILAGKYNNGVPAGSRLAQEENKMFYWDIFLNPDIHEKKLKQMNELAALAKENGVT